MRVMEFKMERPGLVKGGDKVTISEGVLPTSYYYVLEPAIAMSKNYSPRERLMAKEGVVKEIKETRRGFYVVVEIEE